jgi:aerobic-type carbon monoxide dehydrogenase small subunit (CoxS/CutS family)
VAEQPTDVEFTLNGETASAAAGGSLLDALREDLGVHSVKDGCSPQGQCGCCTVWVDGQPRVSCVTPVARVRGRSVTTIEGLADADSWAATFHERGGSQCGFCTPGIIMRAAALESAKRSSPDAVRQALLAHMCRCTGWHPIVESVVSFAAGRPSPEDHPIDRPRRSADAQRRATIEGGVPQQVGESVALGQGGFADDTAPPGALVAVRGADGDWVVGETLAQARRLSGKVQGRRTTSPLSWPIDVPAGDWALTLQTSWVEPAYLEPDASWCAPGGEPMSSHGNGGAFGGKQSGQLGATARRLADVHGRPVRVLSTREDVVRLGAKRPPMAAGVTLAGSGLVHVARTEGIVEAIHSIAPDVEVVEVDILGPPTSSALRGSGWVELAVLLAALDRAPPFTVKSPDGAEAVAEIAEDGSIRVRVACGDPLDLTVLRSYCVGAAHMALGWVTSEGLSVDEAGVPHDLTIRSFGVLRAVDTPPIEVEIVESGDPPVNGGDAVFAAVAAAAWHRAGWAPRWPTGR